MSPRVLVRLVLYVLLLSSQLWPGVAMPSHATSEMAGGQNQSMLCHGEHAPKEAAAPGCKDRCCPHMTCDAGACASLACLPVVAEVPQVPMPTAAATRWNAAPAPLRLMETLLRPPIG